jgi:hypothetical protein
MQLSCVIISSAGQLQSEALESRERHLASAAQLRLVHGWVGSNTAVIICKETQQMSLPVTEASLKCPTGETT